MRHLEPKKYEAFISMWQSRANDSNIQDWGSKGEDAKIISTHFNDPSSILHMCMISLYAWSPFTQFLQRSDPHGHMFAEY